MCVVSHAAELLSIEIIEFESEYVVSQAASLVSIDVERISILSFSSWSVPPSPRKALPSNLNCGAHSGLDGKGRPLPPKNLKPLRAGYGIVL